MCVCVCVLLVVCVCDVVCVRTPVKKYAVCRFGSIKIHK